MIYVNIQEMSVMKPYKQQVYCCLNNNRKLIELQSLLLVKMGK